MKHKLILTFLALSLCAAAQNSTGTGVAGVSITGPLLDAVIENHSTQAVIAVNVAYSDAQGGTWRHQRLFTSTGLGLAPGASESLNTWSKHQHYNTPGAPATIVAYAVTAVVFVSGELQGDERGDATGRFMSATQTSLQAMRSIWEMASDNKWKEVEECSKIEAGDVYTSSVAYSSCDDYMGKIAGARLLTQYKRLGAKRAVAAYSYLNSLPQNIWIGGTIARLQHVPVIMDLLAWLHPVSAYAQGTFINVATWPFTSYNPPYYQSQWWWGCTDQVSNNLCPVGTGSTSPFQGVKATCTTGNYTIGVQGQVTRGSPDHEGWNNSSGTSANPYNLRQNGQCNNQDTGDLEGWSYTNYCQGSGQSFPIKQNDNTGQYNVCGIGINGYF